MCIGRLDGQAGVELSDTGARHSAGKLRFATLTPARARWNLELVGRVQCPRLHGAPRHDSTQVINILLTPETCASRTCSTCNQHRRIHRSGTINGLSLSSSSFFTSANVVYLTWTVRCSLPTAHCPLRVLDSTSTSNLAHSSAFPRAP